MTRITLVPEPPEDARVAAVFEEVTSRWPSVPNLYRVLGAAPEMLRAWVDMAWRLRLEATTPRRLRELIILRAAQVLESGYEWAHHVPMAREAGVSQAEIDGLGNWPTVTSFTAAERLAIRLAEEVAEGPQASAETVEALKRHFSEAEIVELTLTACFYVCVARFLASLDVDLEPGYGGPRSALLSNS